jgi:hypothetical protein
MATTKKTSKTSKKTPAKAKAKGGKPPAGTQSKADFIREKLKTGLSPVAIVAAAKEGGITIPPAMVYKVRSRMVGKKSGAPTAAAKAKPGPKPKDGGMSASAFVRSMPTTMKAKEVSEAAKAKGLKVTSGLVYMVRSAEKKKTGGGTASAPKAKGKPGPKPKTQYQDWKPSVVIHGGGGGDETAFKKMALEIGFPRALRVIEELAKKAEAVQRQYQALLG